MTPPATTAAGHGRSVQRKAAPAHPRRVSGPARRGDRQPRAGGRAAASNRGRAAAAPAPAVQQHAARALALIKSLPEHSLLDRVVRGRAWIALLGVLLAG